MKVVDAIAILQTAAKHEEITPKSISDGTMVRLGVTFFKVETTVLERKAITEALEACNTNRFLPFKGMLMPMPRMKCLGCGKMSGIIDLVYTALATLSHTVEQLRNRLQLTEVIETRAHTTTNCACCGLPYPIPFGWASNFGWSYE